MEGEGLPTPCGGGGAAYTGVEGEGLPTLVWRGRGCLHRCGGGGAVYIGVEGEGLAVCRLPISWSPLAEMVATCAISSGVVTGLDSFFKDVTVASTAAITPLRNS